MCFAVAAPEVPVTDSTCELSTVPDDTMTFTNPEYASAYAAHMQYAHQFE